MAEGSHWRPTVAIRQNHGLWSFLRWDAPPAIWCSSPWNNVSYCLDRRWTQLFLHYSIRLLELPQLPSHIHQFWWPSWCSRELILRPSDDDAEWCNLFRKDAHNYHECHQIPELRCVEVWWYTFQPKHDRHWKLWHFIFGNSPKLTWIIQESERYAYLCLRRLRQPWLALGKSSYWLIQIISWDSGLIRGSRERLGRWQLSWFFWINSCCPWLWLLREEDQWSEYPCWHITKQILRFKRESQTRDAEPHIGSRGRSA